jgi:hypothetical protein
MGGDSGADGLRAGRCGMTREQLPNRRSSESCDVRFGAHKIHVMVGFAPDGRVLEVFARTAKPQSDLDLEIDDAAVLISRLLQHGDGLAAIRQSLGRLPDGRPASVIAAIVDEAVELAGSGEIDHE